MRRAPRLVAALCLLSSTASAQNVVTPGSSPFRYDYPDAYFDYGGIKLPRNVAGGSKGGGTINAVGLYIGGLPVFATSGSIPDGHCVQVIGGKFTDFGGPCSSFTNVVTTRTATGSMAVAITSTDYLVCLDGPTEADLEASPTIGQTHIIVDCRANGGAAISIVGAGSATINGQSPFLMTQNNGQLKQSVTVTYVAGYSWRVN